MRIPPSKRKIMDLGGLTTHDHSRYMHIRRVAAKPTPIYPERLLPSMDVFPTAAPAWRKEAVDALLVAVDLLPTREQQVIVLRFGLAGEHETKSKDIGRVLGVTRERVRQIEDHALRRLYDALAEIRL